MVRAMSRPDGRAPDALRPLSFEPGFIAHHKGSVLVSFGQTRVLCACTVEDRVPPFRVSSGHGWLTATYSMLPASTHERRRREVGKQDGRSVEIQRLIGRALRNVVDIDALPGITLNVDCDVLQADGGTRCASITGGYVALALCLAELRKAGKVASVDKILTSQVAAVSVGILDGVCVADLNYKEDRTADTDLNLIARSDGGIVEVQGTAEGAPMQRAELTQLLDLGLASIETICAAQREAIEAAT